MNEEKKWKERMGEGEGSQGKGKAFWKRKIFSILFQ